MRLSYTHTQQAWRRRNRPIAFWSGMRSCLRSLALVALCAPSTSAARAQKDHCKDKARINNKENRTSSVLLIHSAAAFRAESGARSHIRIARATFFASATGTRATGTTASATARRATAATIPCTARYEPGPTGAIWCTCRLAAALLSQLLFAQAQFLHLSLHDGLAARLRWRRCLGTSRRQRWRCFWRRSRRAAEGPFAKRRGCHSAWSRISRFRFCGL